MAATSLLDVLQWVESLMVSTAFGYTLCPEPLAFDRMPSQQAGVWCRVEGEMTDQSGGMSFRSDERGRVTVWIARPTTMDAHRTYQQLLTDATSLVSATVRDGSTGGGDYDVEDGRTAQISQRPGDDYTVLRLSLPVRYEAAL